MPESLAPLRDQLDRWTAAGIIDAGQAARIESAERQRAEQGAEKVVGGALPRVAEVLGYLGAVIAVSAGYVAIRQLWPRVPPAATLSFTAVTTVSLTVAGAALRTRVQPAYRRLRSVLWLLATAVGTGFAAILADQVLGLGDRGLLLTAAATWSGLAVPFWWRGKSALLHVAMFGGLAALLCAGLYQIAPHLTASGYGTALWVLSAIWGIAAWKGYAAPPTAGLAAASTGVLVGATLTMGSPAGQALALLTVAGLLAIGVATNRVMFTGFGAAGMLWVVPDAAYRYLPGPVAAPLAVVVAGLVLLVIALRLARARKKTRFDGQDPSW